MLWVGGIGVGVVVVVRFQLLITLMVLTGEMKAVTTNVFRFKATFLDQKMPAQKQEKNSKQFILPRVPSLQLLSV